MGADVDRALASTAPVAPGMKIKGLFRLHGREPGVLQNAGRPAYRRAETPLARQQRPAPRRARRRRGPAPGHRTRRRPRRQRRGRPAAPEKCMEFLVPHLAQMPCTTITFESRDSIPATWPQCSCCFHGVIESTVRIEHAVGRVEPALSASRHCV